MRFGGSLVEVLKTSLVTANGTPLVRLWVMDHNGDEICTMAEQADVMPVLGETIWWHSMCHAMSGPIFFGTGRHLMKFGAAFMPPGCQFNCSLRAR